MITFLYYLADPRAPRRPRYVGITSDPAARQERHASPNSTSTAMRDWKRALDRSGLAPVLAVLAEFATEAEARGAEWRLIQRWRRRGLCDLNRAVEGRRDRLALMRRAMAPEASPNRQSVSQQNRNGPASGSEEVCVSA